MSQTSSSLCLPLGDQLFTTVQFRPFLGHNPFPQQGPSHTFLLDRGISSQATNRPDLCLPAFGNYPSLKPSDTFSTQEWLNGLLIPLRAQVSALCELAGWLVGWLVGQFGAALICPHLFTLNMTTVTFAETSGNIHTSTRPNPVGRSNTFHSVMLRLLQFSACCYFFIRIFSCPYKAKFTLSPP